jgi:putative membrane protein
MTAVSAIFSALHLLALGIGLFAVSTRGRELAGRLDDAALKRVFRADALWGIAAVLWLVTGSARAFGPLEKGTDYYLHNPLFHVKIGLFLLVFLIELWPMTALIRWRGAIKRGEAPDLSRAKLFARLSHLEAALVTAIVFVAAFMARGFGAR